jgi:hypothetical protein
MRRQPILLLAAMGVALVLIASACGGGSSTSEDVGSSGGERYDVGASMTSLQEAAWQAVETEGDPETYAGVTQVGYLETTAPDGEPIDLQFFESPEDAQSELSETEKQEYPFEGTTEGNVLVFDPTTDTAAVSPENLEALQGLLT